jgi:hypothetical protein
MNSFNFIGGKNTKRLTQNSVTACSTGLSCIDFSSVREFEAELLG